MRSLVIFTNLVMFLSILAKRQDFVNILVEVNASQGLWKADLIPGIDYEDDASLERLVGADVSIVPEPAGEIKTRPRMLQTYQNTNSSDPNSLYPSSLDLRTKYPFCRSISIIRIQKACGGCWAFGTMNALSDRYCISKSNDTNVEEKFFSVQDTLECCTSCNGGSGNGCRGGAAYVAMQYAKNVGVVSGEGVIDDGFCKPYMFDISPVIFPILPVCKSACTDPNSEISYQEDKTKVQNIIYGTKEPNMIAALNNGGSITATMVVFKDFLLYKSGIYAHTTEIIVGAHVIRIIGYGEENGVKYWLCANSWGTAWGEQGFFKILRGTNESSIESNFFFAGTFI